MEKRSLLRNNGTHVPESLTHYLIKIYYLINFIINQKIDYFNSADVGVIIDLRVYSLVQKATTGGF